jgi:hypothetical protein
MPRLDGRGFVNELTPEQRSMRARMAAHRRWAKTPDRTAAMKKANQAFMDRFEREVDPDGTLPPDVRAKLAASARSAYFTELAFKSSRARSKRKRD